MSEEKKKKSGESLDSISKIPNWGWICISFTAIQKRKQQAQSEREKKRNEFEVEFSNLELEGITVSAEELAKKLGTNSRELLSWLGNGNRQKKILKDGFEKYMWEDGKMYIRRKG